MTTVRLDEHAEAVAVALEATGRPVGRAERPPGIDPMQASSFPYFVLYPQGGTRDGTIADPDADAVLVYALHCVALDLTGVLWAASEASAVFQSLVFTIPSRRVNRAQLLNDSPVDPEYDVTPHLFVAKPIWSLWTTPA